MSDAPVAIASPPSHRGLPFEHAIFVLSPFGLLPTTLLLFIALFGSFVAIASAEGIPIVRQGGFSFSDAGWPALVLSLLCCTALAMQRYARVAEAREAPNYARILSGGTTSALAVTSATPSEARLGRATLMGVAVGAVLSVAIRVAEYREGHVIPPGAMTWFALATTLLAVLFARGVEQSRAGNRAYARTLQSELTIDLLRTDTLSVLGRSAARHSLIWFVVSGVACLFFVRGDLDWLTMLLIAGCATMGITMFAASMGRIHHQIVDAKMAELERIRCRIDALRNKLHEDAFASQSLHGLLAYEKRVQEAQEWPFDQTTLVRVAASTLILTVPWFGQAIAAYVVDHLSRFAG
jgi:hypothetical protein